MFSNKKTHNHKLFLIWLFFTFFLASQGFSQAQNDSTIHNSISKALQSGQAKELSELFYEKVDIILPNQSGIYSKSQAFFIIKDFFEKNPPVSFQVINQNFNNGSSFVVGKLHTAKQHFRVCYLTKYSDNLFYIYQFRIEE